MNVKQIVRPEIVRMKPYTPIAPFAALSRRLGRPSSEITKLDANENPYGASPKALAALAALPDVHIYPDPEATPLREALSGATGVPQERLLAGAGADELIDLVFRAVLSPGDGAVDCPPSFGMYPFSAAVNNGRYLPVPRRADFSLDVEAIEQTVREQRPKLLVLCSPNNPDGSVIDDDSLRRLLKLPVLVVLDEAYVDFAGEVNRKGCEEREEKKESFAPFAVGRLRWALEYDNLVALRTFSKLAGLAGLRVGYGAFPDWLLPHLWKIKQPYNINAAAMAAAAAALDDLAWLQEKARLIAAERERLWRLLAAVEWLRPYPSQANFILCRVDGRDAAQLKQALEQRGVLVRYFNKPGLDNCIRISVGRPSDTDALLKALRKIGDRD